MSSIRVFYTEEEIANRPPDGYYLAVRVKIPRVIGVADEDQPGFIPPTLDPTNSPHHSDPRVLLAETRLVVFDISAHPECPKERTTAAGDRFLADHLHELDRSLRDYLG